MTPHGIAFSGLPVSRPALSPLEKAVRVVTQLVDRAYAWAELRRQRRDLMRLDDRLLHDIGISRAEAETEYRRSSLL